MSTPNHPHSRPLDCMEGSLAADAVMNPVETLMRKRSSHVKLALAVAALVLVLWAAGSSVLSLWVTPVVIFVLWAAVQLRLGYRHRHRPA